MTLETDGKPIRFIDTPGLTWSSASPDATETETETTHSLLRARDILLRNKGRIDRLKDSSPAGKPLFFDVPSYKPLFFVSQDFKKANFNLSGALFDFFKQLNTLLLGLARKTSC